MKVLFFTTACDPQMEVQSVHQEFLQRLQERGCEVSILTSRGGSSRGDLYLWEEVADIPMCRFGLHGHPTDELLNLLSELLFRYHGLLTILRRYRGYFERYPHPDVIHVESAFPLGAVAASARRDVPIPYVINVRGADLFNEPEARFGYARYPLVRSLLRLAFRHAAATRATTPQTEQIALALGAAPEQVRVIARNIRDECFHDDLPPFRERARADIVQRHQLSPRGQILVAAGRLLPIKGFDFILHALPTILQAVPDTTLFLCGATRTDPILGDYQSYLERLATDVGVRDRVIFTGDLPATQFTRYLASADLVVVPSIREGSNKVLMEGAALGVPFVATTTTGAVAFFRQPAGGVEVPPGDARALAAAISGLLLDDLRRQNLGQQAAQNSLRFRSEQVAEEMLHLYTWVLTEQRAPA